MEQQALSEDELFKTDMTVGEIFRRTRTHYGQSLGDIERALRIRASQLEAIETGNIEKLPGRVYAIGFVRSYAEYLGLNGDKMVHLFKIQVGGKAPKPKLDFPVSASESKIPPVYLVFFSITVATLIVVGWWAFSGGDRTMVNDIPAPPAPSAVVAPQFAPEEAGPDTMGPQNTGVVPDTTASVPPAEEAVVQSAVQKGVILNITANSWVEIKDQTGNAVVSRVLKAGEQYYVPDRPDLSMSLGNAGGVAIVIDGVALLPLGNAGEVKRNIPLDVDDLKNHYSKPAENKTE
jgi:cytoskeleton protein RodZ